MSYIVYTSSGTVLTTIPTGKINTASSSITLIGRDVTNYGRYYNQNLINILGNFANTTSKPPRNPLQGQLWYDTTYKKLRVYNGGYHLIGTAIVSDVQPIGQEPGELWFDTINRTFNFLDDDGQYNSVTSFPRYDVSGWKFPLTPVYDNNFPGDIQQVTLLQSYGQVVGALTTASFIASEVSSTTTFGLAGTSTFAVSAGLTIIGDIYTTNKLKVGSGIELISSNLKFPDTTVQTTAFSTASYISKANLKVAVAAANSWTDFQSFIAAL